MSRRQDHRTFHRAAARLGVLAASLVTLSATPAHADMLTEVLDEGAREVARTIRPGSVLIWYCEACSRAYHVRLVEEARVASAGTCLAEVVLDGVILFKGKGAGPGTLGLDVAGCLPPVAEGEDDGRMEFAYSFLATKDPAVFAGVAAGTVLEDLASAGSLRLTPADRRAIDACVARYAKARDRAAKRTAGAPRALGQRREDRGARRGEGAEGPSVPERYIDAVRARHAAITGGADPVCALSADAAEHLVHVLGRGMTLVWPDGHAAAVRRASSERVIGPGGTVGHRVLVDGAPLDAQSTFFLRSDGRITPLSYVMSSVCDVQFNIDVPCFDRSLLEGLPEPTCGDEGATEPEQ